MIQNNKLQIGCWYDLIPHRLLLHQNDKFTKNKLSWGTFFIQKWSTCIECTHKKWCDLRALAHHDKLTDFKWENFSGSHALWPLPQSWFPFIILIEYFCDPYTLRQEHHQRAVFVESPGQRNHWHLCQHLCPFKVWLLEILGTSHMYYARCSKSLSDGVASAQHEEMMAKLWCAEAQSRWLKNR